NALPQLTAMFHATLEEHVFVSKVEPKQTQNTSWSCNCYNGTNGLEFEFECRCHGKELLEIPSDLDENLYRITLTDSDIKFLNKNSFQPYKESLRDVVLGNLPMLRVIEEGTFRDIPNFRTLYISQTPQMKFLSGLFMGVTAQKFRSLRIIQTGLQEIPDLSFLYDNIVQMIELDGNKIERIPSNAINIKAAQVTLNYNEISTIDNYAFNGSHIASLSLKGNAKLHKIQPYAFKGLHSLQQLDISGTSIENLPAVGISEIEVLKVENTPTMKTIPSIYELKSLQEAYLTHPFHCCAFKYPAQHDPKGYAQYQETIKAACKNTVPALDTGQTAKVKRRSPRRVESWSDPFSDSGYIDVHYEAHHNLPNTPLDWTPNIDHFKAHTGRSDYGHLYPLRGQTIEHIEGLSISEEEDFGTFHQTSAEILENKPVNAFCGNITNNTRMIKCYPEPNALNPCEDIMGSYWLRISVWFVVILAVMGNLAVIIVVIFSGGEVSVQRFLICNLAFADFFMGLYLLFIASMDLYSVGSYFNSAFDWQYGVGCQVAGFLTMFASQLSVFTLTVVTIERWFAITHAMHLTRRIRIGAAAKIMCMGWLYSLLIAALPLFGVSNYSSTSICLPMEINQLVDKAYLITIIVLNTIAFALIVFCYAQIYFSLGYETRHCSTNGEMTIAKKMALLVFTDFACWAPIAFFSLTALAGYPLIGVTRSKILLVFFYPLNSCANPYLYAIMTAQYRRDFFLLLSRCGICRKAAQHYTLTTTSLPTANNSHPIPLLMIKSNGEQINNKPENYADDAFV
ncbi:hypothetical protein RN001_000743, partial [Aquatica leii]